jgi:O-acetyl-ADP-ribose deacetylase (regulator of RNase III)
MTSVERTIGNGRIVCVLGDITRESVDVIVNAANESLLGGGGVDGAIHRAGGPAILEECRTLGGCPTGDAKMTTGGNLPARFVIHTVGPIYRNGGGREAVLLRQCHIRSLEIAEDRSLHSIAFPAISCGIYGYPVQKAATIAIETAKDWLKHHREPSDIRFVLFSEDVYHVFQYELIK